MIAAVAGLTLDEIGVIDSDGFLGMDSFRVMLWALAIASLTSPIMVTYIVPLPTTESEARPDDEDEENG